MRTTPGKHPAPIRGRSEPATVTRHATEAESIRGPIEPRTELQPRSPERRHDREARRAVVDLGGAGLAQGWTHIVDGGAPEVVQDAMAPEPCC